MTAAKTLIAKDWRKAEPAKTDRSRKIHRFEQMRVTRSEDLPELLTTSEAAKFLCRHPKTIEEYRNDGSLKFIKIRGRYFTTPEFIAEFIDRESKK